MVADGPGPTSGRRVAGCGRATRPGGEARARRHDPGGRPPGERPGKSPMVYETGPCVTAGPGTTVPQPPWSSSFCG